MTTYKNLFSNLTTVELDMEDCEEGDDEEDWGAGNEEDEEEKYDDPAYLGQIVDEANHKTKDL